MLAVFYTFSNPHQQPGGECDQACGIFGLGLLGIAALLIGGMIWMLWRMWRM